jgi:hypothetical protein
MRSNNRSIGRGQHHHHDHYDYNHPMAMAAARDQAAYLQASRPLKRFLSSGG